MATLFDTAADPWRSPWTTPRAAGVGKGTLFRRFGDRAGLLRALFQAKIAVLTAAVATGPPPLGPGTPAPERITAVLDAIVTFKLSNRHITHALAHLDPRAGHGSFFDTPNYKWAHALFTELLDGIARGQAGWLAHVLLSLTGSTSSST